MTNFLNPWVILGVLLAIVGAGGVGYYKGNEHAKTAALAEQAKQMTIEEKIERSIAAGLSQIKVTNRTIQGKVETITREVPVYSDCHADPAVVGLLNDLLAGKAGAKPVGDRVVPASDRTP